MFFRYTNLVDYNAKLDNITLTKRKDKNSLVVIQLSNTEAEFVGMLSNHNPVLLVKVNNTFVKDKSLTDIWKSQVLTEADIISRYNNKYRYVRDYGFITYNQYEWYCRNKPQLWKFSHLPKVFTSRVGLYAILPKEQVKYNSDLKKIKAFCETHAKTFSDNTVLEHEYHTFSLNRYGINWKTPYPNVMEEFASSRP